MTEPAAAPPPATEAPPAEIDRRLSRFGIRGLTLRHQAARGTIVNAAFTIGVSLLALVKGFILAGFLSRADYGVWGVLAVSLGTLVLLKQVGISDKYVQQEDDDQELAFQRAFTMELLVTGAFVVLLLAALPLVAWVYGEPKLILPGAALVAILPAGLLQMPLFVHYRRMDFVRQRLLQSVDPVVAFAVSIALAVAGAGYWAFVAGILAGAWAAAAAAVLTSPFKLAIRYDRLTLRSYFGFSWPLFIAMLGSVVIAQSSALMTDLHLGLAAVGAITLAHTITQFAERVDHLITETLYPAICAVRDRVDLLQESFVKSNRLALMWSMPFGFGLTLFAPDLVDFAIGDQWQPAVVVLQVYGAAAALSGVAFNWDAYFRAVGDTKPMAVASMAAMVTFLVTAIPLLIEFGLPGFAAGIAAQAVAHMLCRAWFLSRLFRGFHYVGHALRAIVPTVPAILAVLLVRWVEEGDRTALMALGELAFYLGTIAACTVAFEGRLLREALGYLRSPAVTQT